MLMVASGQLKNNLRYTYLNILMRNYLKIRKRQMLFFAFSVYIYMRILQMTRYMKQRAKNLKT